MWEMLEDNIECDECGGNGQPPKFMIPPPPRPPFMQDISTTCRDEDGWDYDMCEAIPILDASYHSSSSLQTSAIVAVLSLLLVLVVLISSLFVWKHKSKVQNFLPCKTPTRDGHLGGVHGGHSVTYEDPDAHLGHRPLVLRHHHNIELLHSKSIHYPSGYPMTRSPPLFVCSSPGPDPYRSNDNVYEELGPGRDSDAESEPAVQSDDDFAEDELSLPGDRSFKMTSSDSSTVPVSTIYHERALLNIGPERNSVVSTSSSTTNNDQRISLFSGLMRQGSLGRKSHQQLNTCKQTKKTSNRNKSVDELNTSSEQTGSDIAPQIYEDSNLSTLPFSNHTENNSLSNNNLKGANNNSNNRIQYYTSLNPSLVIDNELERRNRINKQLHRSPVSTIFREQISCDTSRYPQPYYNHNTLFGNHHRRQQHNQQNHHRSRTNPRSLDRRRIAGISNDREPTYGYTEPIYHESLLYDTCMAHTNNNILRTPTYSYVLPEFTKIDTNVQFQNQMYELQQKQQNQELLQPQLQQICSRDSSFGSDSGYSHHTHTSGCGGGGGGSSTSGISAGCGRSNSSSNKISLNFVWNRRSGKDNMNQNTNTTNSNNNTKENS